MNNASVLTAIGITGLQLYKFGKTSSIPFENENVQVPYDVLKSNLKNNLHTLFLLDLNPEKNKFVSINEALKRLLDQGMEDRLCVGIERLGFDEKIVVKNAKELINVEFNKYPQCLIVVGKLHFLEEELLNSF